MSEMFDWMQAALQIADGPDLAIALLITSLVFYLPLCVLQAPRRAPVPTGDPLTDGLSLEALHDRLSCGYGRTLGVALASPGA